MFHKNAGNSLKANDKFIIRKYRRQELKFCWNANLGDDDKKNSDKIYYICRQLCQKCKRNFLKETKFVLSINRRRFGYLNEFKYVITLNDITFPLLNV